MLSNLKGIDADWRDRILIMNRYIHPKAVVKIVHEHTEESHLGRGVRVVVCHHCCSYSTQKE